MAKVPPGRAEFDRMEKRLAQVEASLRALAAWIASKQRAEAQAKADEDDKPVIQERDESGEPWLR